MKYALFADVHGNSDALNAVLADPPFRDADKKIFLGDAVGYGADPSYTLDTIVAVSHAMIAGNHDAVAGSGDRAVRDRAGMPSVSDWTRSQLSHRQLDMLSGLPETCTTDNFLCVHGSPDRPGQWRYILDKSDANAGFAATPAPLVFTGHSHVPAVFAEVEVRRFFAGETRRIKQMGETDLHLSPEYRYIINPGSVGQPRDGDPRSAYCIYDSHTSGLCLHRVQYDVDAARRKIIEAGLPHETGERLRHGR